jgi:hypothetical protein
MSRIEVVLHLDGGTLGRGEEGLDPVGACHI